MDTVSLTILVENTARQHDLLAEHGLSIWVEAGPHRILFDTGQTGVLRHNAGKLGIRLGTADTIVLSHGHYDHTGGLAATPLSDASRRVDRDTQTGPDEPLHVFAHADCFADKFFLNADGTSRDIGMPLFARDALRRSAKITRVDGPTKISDSIVVTGPIPRRTDFEDTGGAFFKDAACSQPDDLMDDQAMFIETPDGIIVILGCAHAGIINTLTYICELAPGRPIQAVIGGMHLVKAHETRITQTIKALRAFNIQKLIPIHCTGAASTTCLHRAFPECVLDSPVGSTYTFPNT